MYAWSNETAFYHKKSSVNKKNQQIPSTLFIQIISQGAGHNGEHEALEGQPGQSGQFAMWWHHDCQGCAAGVVRPFCPASFAG